MDKFNFMSFVFTRPDRTLVFGYILIILIAGLMLMLPFSHNGSITPVDAFFTATSAICVTGLIVKDTPHDFTIFGQIVILVLIQIGGIGIMAFSSLIAMILGKRLGLFSSLSLINI